MTASDLRRILWRRAKSDWGIVIITLALVALGLVMTFSTSKELPYINPLFEGGADTYFRSQLTFALIGLGAMLFVSRINYRLYRRFVVPIGLLTLAMLVLMAAMQGRFLFTREEDIGQVGRGQLTELAKYGVIVYLAAWLSAAGGRLKQFRTGMLPAAMILAISCGLVVLQRDLSTTMLLGVTCMVMLFVAGANARQLLALLVLGAAVVAALALLVSWRQQRIVAFMNPLNDPWDKGYQAVRSMVALNNGRLFGTGLAQGIENRNLHSMAHTDFMFAMVAEQLGFLGAMATIGLYVAWAWRGFAVALRSVDTFGRLLAVGLVSWEICRALLHLAVVTNTVPITGTVLPFMSYGGSALVSGLAALGILVNISRQATIAAEATQ
ncbi:MAG: FtsW/RodA/SpoVE family cell cycle protein [Chloroflexi bacterium]|jgi:cell division protein FtsW|nr:FtsW/RodA/SpoVE family cell cycle protein [Chloroflexota bacterium]